MYARVHECRGLVDQPGEPRPLILCEYSHAMGNSNGGLADYWAAFRTHRSMQGGFIWDWADQGLLQAMPDGTRRWAYGGDFGDEPNDKQFCINGLVFPDRSPHPAMEEARHVQRPLIAEAQPGGSVLLSSTLDFLDTAWLRLSWSHPSPNLSPLTLTLAQAPAPTPTPNPTRAPPLTLTRELTRDGVRLDGSAWDAAPAVPPSGAVLLPAESLPWAAAAARAFAQFEAGEVAVTLHAHVGGDHQRTGPGLPAGVRLCHNQLVLPRPVGSAAAAAAAAPRFKELRAMAPLRLESLGASQGAHRGWRVEGEAVAVTVDGGGVLRGLRLHGEEVALPQPPTPALTPTPTRAPAPSPAPSPAPNAPPRWWPSARYRACGARRPTTMSTAAMPRRGGGPDSTRTRRHAWSRGCARGSRCRSSRWCRWIGGCAAGAASSSATRASRTRCTATGRWRCAAASASSQAWRHPAAAAKAAQSAAAAAARAAATATTEAARAAAATTAVVAAA